MITSKYPFLILVVSCVNSRGFKVMDRKRGHPADHGALLTLRLNNGGVDVRLLEVLDRLLFALPFQPLMQPVTSEAFVVPVEMNPFQDQSQSWSFGYVHLRLSPAPLHHILLRVALYHGDHQANHLADLVHHEALASHSYHSKLSAAADERLSAGHLCDVTAGAGVAWSLLRSEVVEVMGAFVERKEMVQPLKCVWLEAKGCYIPCIIVFRGEGHCWKHVGVCTSITVVFGIETLGDPFKTCQNKT